MWKVKQKQMVDSARCWSLAGDGLYLAGGSQDGGDHSREGRDCSADLRATLEKTGKSCGFAAYSPGLCQGICIV